MKAHTLIILAAVLMILFAAVSVLVKNQPTQQSPIIPVTSLQMVDVAQRDEIVKTVGNSNALPALLNDYSPAQLERFQITDPQKAMSIQVTDKTKSTPALLNDYSLAQRERFQITDPQEAMSIRVTGKTKSTPALLNDYSLAQRERYQITDPMP